MVLGLNAIVSRLHDVRQSGSGYTAKCPAHDDQRNSLSIGPGDNGGTVIHCHAGCQSADVVAAVGLTLADLAPPGDGPSKIVAQYSYHDETGELLFQVCRMHPKDFRCRRPDGNGAWSWKLADTRRVLYRFPEVLAANPSQTVFVCEGEKDCDRLAALGFVTTTNAGGAGKWRDDYGESLRGRSVVILPDNDEPGRKHAQQVAKSLSGTAASVRILELQNLPPKGDVSDWLDAGGSVDDLMHLASEAPIWTPAEPATPGAGARKLVMVNLADVQPRPVNWLWPGRMALGKLTVLAGEPGLGKSFLTLDIAARVTRGMAWPDKPDGGNPAGSVVLLSGEDDVADTIRPRLDAAGADVRRVSAIQGFEYQANADGPLKRDFFNLERDLPELERAIKASPNCRLVIIDPVACYMGDTDSHKDAAVRGLLGPLADLASRLNVAVLTILHLNKAEGRSALHRVTGSGAYVAAARSAWLVAMDKANRERRLFLEIKNNIAPHADGLAFSMADSDVMLCDGNPVAKLCWETGIVTLTADDALNADPKTDQPTARDEAVDFLSEQLAGAAIMQRIVADAAKEEGISDSALRRAKKCLGVESRKLWYGRNARTFWTMPDRAAVSDEMSEGLSA